MRNAAAFLLLTSALGAAYADTPPLWGPHVDIEAKPGSKRNLGEADLFLPLMQDARTLVFGNLRTRFDNQSSYEGNFGAGARRMLDNGWNLGAYGYWDHRRSSFGNFFDQATLGVEALGRDFEWRANGYLPVGTNAYSLGSNSVAALSGTSIQVTTTTREERALKGFDVEAGWRVPLFDSEGAQQLRLYAGHYRFADADVRVEGPRLRAELALQELPWLGNGASLFLGAETQHDNARGHQNFLSVRLRIPLGKESSIRSGLNAQQRRMTAPVMRDVDVVTQSRVASTLVETANATASGQAITVLNSATTTTAAALNTALATAGANTVILSGTFNTNAQINMAAGQTIIGGGALAVKTASGYTASLTLPGATIAATGNSTQMALVMATNATLNGMTITNPYAGGLGSGGGVSAQGMTGVTIRNNVITVGGAQGGYAVDALGAVNAVISGNTITATSSGISSAIGIRAPAGSVTIANNTFNLAGTTQYVVAGSNTTVFAAGSSGNVTNSGVCFFVGGAPTGSVGFSTISCP